MAKAFRYYAHPEEIQEYLEGLGYQVQIQQDSYNDEIAGFRVVNTTVGLSCDDTLNGRVLARGNIYMRPSVTDDDVTERSEKLYLRLKRRFGKPRG